MMKVFKSKTGSLTILDDGTYMLIRVRYGDNEVIHRVETESAADVIDMDELEDGMPVEQLFAIVDEKLAR